MGKENKTREGNHGKNETERVSMGQQEQTHTREYHRTTDQEQNRQPMGNDRGNQVPFAPLIDRRTSTDPPGIQPWPHNGRPRDKTK